MGTASGLSRVPVRERYRGCLLASAAGDALGAPLEFVTDEAGLRRLGGESGVADLLPAYGRVGAITDDTQMTMATACGLLAAGGRDAPDDEIVTSVYEAYLDWHRSQEDPAQRRAPGRTCLSALGSGRMGTRQAPLNDSKGSGGVMRVAPVGLAFAGDPDRAYHLGVATAAITHGHPGGYLPAGVLAALISRLVAGEDLRAALESEFQRRELALDRPGRELLDLLRRAVDLAEGPAPPWDAYRALDTLGRGRAEGWVGDEALAMALFAALRHAGSLERAVITAAYHAGDSDTTGAVAGAVMGAHLGERAIPARWLEALEGREELAVLAEAFLDRFQGPESITGQSRP